MSIPESMIDRTIEHLFSQSDPGDEIHYLHVISAPKGAIGPLGVPDENKLEVTIAAIVPDTPTPQEVPAWIRKACAGVYAKHVNEGKLIMFAAVSQEVWVAPVGDELGARLQREGRLHEHPDAAELTIVYGAARDGRRWRGSRYLTGPEAGKGESDMLVGRVTPDEISGICAAPVLLKMVGLA